jgi:ankyrin repeat protein
MGACETLNAAGMRFLAEIDAPFTDANGDRLAPLAMALETYSRNPSGKHEVLDIFAAHGYSLPDTPLMAFHRGDIARLKEFLRDPALAQRRFACQEIFPPELGCGGGGMCGTPLEGATLLHLAIDYDEREIFDLLLARGADVNARAAVDSNGFGGQTPLFNAIISCAYICGRQRDAAMTRALLERGASTEIRASLRKFLDWIEQLRWHEARDVTAAEWARGFPHSDWVSPEAMRLIVGE